LVRCEAGIRIRELNTALHERHLALPNMGGFDEQTVAGVMSTATHGSGIAFGPIASFVMSMDVVDGTGRVVRLERGGGPPGAVRCAGRYRPWRLVQDDEWFDAAVVGLGCMGVVYAVTLGVQKAYWLKEVRTCTTWSKVKTQLTHAALASHRHYELLFNPHPDR